MPETNSRYILAFRNLVGVMVKPVPTFRSMLEAPRLTEALLVVLIASFSRSLSSLLNPPAIPRLPSLLKGLQFLFSPAFIIPVGLVGSVIFWIIGGMILHASLRFFKGKGNLRQTLLIFGFSDVPFIYSIFFGVLAWAIGSTLFSKVGDYLLAIWSFILLVLGMREAHKLSTFRSFVAIIFPAIVLIAVIFAMLFVGLILISILRLPLWRISSICLMQMSSNLQAYIPC